jgi:hypothetical protein
VSRKKKLEVAKDIIAAPEPAEIVKIPFAHWFSEKVKSGKLRHYQDEALLVFLKKQGLGELESADNYEAALKKF